MRLLLVIFASSLLTIPFQVLLYVALGLVATFQSFSLFVSKLYKFIARQEKQSKYLLGIRIPKVHEPKGIPERESKGMRRRLIFSLLDCMQCGGIVLRSLDCNIFPG